MDKDLTKADISDLRETVMKFAPKVMDQARKEVGTCFSYRKADPAKDVRKLLVDNELWEGFAEAMPNRVLTLIPTGKFSDGEFLVALWSIMENVAMLDGYRTMKKSGPFGAMMAREVSQVLEEGDGNT